ncbi:MAG: D-alanyl-D-alanine carboxypeptidase/D-alanyl-D-alanine-endopeptidase [Synechococcus sp.]
MKQLFLRRLLARRLIVLGISVLLLVALAIARPTASAQPDFKAQVEQLARRSPLTPATYTVSLRDVASGDVVAELGGDNSMVPASTLKLVGTSLAMSVFPSDRRFSTQLLLPQPVESGVADSLVVVGGGDPTFGSHQIDGNPTTEQILGDIVSAVQATGITAVQRLVGDISALPLEPIPWSWTYDDFGNYFGAPVSALSIHDNLYKLTFQPGQVGQPAEIVGIDPDLNWLTFHNQMKTDAAGTGDNGYIFGVPGSRDRWIKGTIPAGGAFPIYGALPDPADTFLRLLQTTLQARGISVDEIALQTQPVSRSGSSILWEHQSPTVREMVNFTNQSSFNLYADGLVALAVQQYEGSNPVATWKQATDAETDWLKAIGVPTKGLRLEDGSGLSRRNLVTADAMTALLRSDRQQSWWPQFWEGLTVSNGRVRPNGVARGKSGFIEGVRTLSGVIRTASDRELAFSVLVNHYDGSVGEANAFISDVLDLIWQQY